MPRHGNYRRRVQVSPQEVKVTHEITVDDLYVCPECGREYKTETGLERHVDDKH